MKGVAKRLCAIALAICSIALVSSGNPERFVVYDSCDYVEINYFYFVGLTGEQTRLRMVQYIWWEWRDSVLLPVLDPITKKDTGHWKQGSGFVVRDYMITRNNGSVPSDRAKVAISVDETGWRCVFWDKDDEVMRSVLCKWLVTSHTLYDVEVENRKIVKKEDRNGFHKARIKR